MFLVRVAHWDMLRERWEVEGKQSHNVWIYKGLVQEALLELRRISSYLGAQKELAPFVLALDIRLTEQSKQLKEDQEEAEQLQDWMLVSAGEMST